MAEEARAEQRNGSFSIVFLLLLDRVPHCNTSQEEGPKPNKANADDEFLRAAHSIQSARLLKKGPTRKRSTRRVGVRAKSSYFPE